MAPLLLLACSDYAFEGDKAEPVDSGHPRDMDTDVVEACNGHDDDGDAVVDEGFGDADADGTADCVDVEECDGLDNTGDGQVDEGFDANGDGLVDCLDDGDEAYCTPFDDFSGWAYTGTGDWHIEEGLLTEGRNGGYEGIAYIADLGIANDFLIQTSTAWTNDANDLTGIAWAVDGEEAYVAMWDDPQGYYGRHSPTGEMAISKCNSSGCSQLVVDTYGELYWPADKSFVTWSVGVSTDQVEVVVNGTVVLTATLPEVAGTGPAIAGVYSNDNDGGVWFDNFCVWKSG